MTQTNLRSVALKTVANYRQAAEHAVGAYRVGGHRLLSVITRRLNQAAARSAGRFAPRLAAALQRANSNVGSVAGKGLDMVSTGTERVIELSSAGVTAQVSAWPSWSAVWRTAWSPMAWTRWPASACQARRWR